MTGWWTMYDVQNLGDTFQAICERFSAVEVEEMVHYHPIHRGMLAWLKTLLPNLIIACISNGAEMAYGVESRSPFLDHVLANFSYTPSADMLVHLEGNQPPIEKWIFREAVKPYVTEEVYGRRKYAFAAPFRYQIGGVWTIAYQAIFPRHLRELRAVGVRRVEQVRGSVDQSLAEKDQLLFRKAVWLAQIISTGVRSGMGATRACRLRTLGKGQDQGRT